MKAWALTAIEKMELIDRPQPRLAKDDDVMVRLAAVGVCGSDIHYYREGRIGDQVVEFPFVIGHEGAGVVERVGPAVKGLRAGDPVAIEPAVWCGECDQCRAGRFHTCRNLRFLGCPGQAPGCLAELVVLPERNLFRLPEGVSLEQAVLAEPLSIGVYSVRRSTLPSGSRIGVLGAGPIGLCVMMAAREVGAGRIYVTDRLADRIDFARTCGAEWSGSPEAVDEIISQEPAGLDVVYECCGDQAALDQAVQLLKPGGRLVIVGIPETATLTLPIHEVRRKEIDVVNIRRQLDCVGPALSMIGSGRAGMDRLITHRFGWEDAAAAFPLVANKDDGVIKALVVQELS